MAALQISMVQQYALFFFALLEIYMGQIKLGYKPNFPFTSCNICHNFFSFDDLTFLDLFVSMLWDSKL